MQDPVVHLGALVRVGHPRGEEERHLLPGRPEARRGGVPLEVLAHVRRLWRALSLLARKGEKGTETRTTLDKSKLKLDS